MRRLLTTFALTAAIATALVGCGEATRNTPPVAGPTPSQSTPIVQPDDLLVGRGMLMQTSVAGPVELCVGAVAESYPPQCGGPLLVGEVDWDTLKPERVSGVTWTNGTVWAVGRLDLNAGESGTFTLERPLSLTPPAGFDVPAEPSTPGFAQLCGDPYAGGGRQGGASPEAQNALTERLPALDGYIGSWVSDGSSMFNVLVTGDADAAFTELREVWKGGLCVEQRDLPSEAELLAAQQAVNETVDGLLSTSPNGRQGSLDIHLTALDSATRELILTTVEPWLGPDEVRITSAFQPLVP